MELPIEITVRLESVDGFTIFKASQETQNIINELLEKQKESGLSESEQQELDKFSELDYFFTSVNCLIRNDKMNKLNYSSKDKYIHLQDCNENGTIYHIGLVDKIPAFVSKFEMFIECENPSKVLNKIKENFQNRSASENFYMFNASIDEVKIIIERIIDNE